MEGVEGKTGDEAESGKHDKPTNYVAPEWILVLLVLESFVKNHCQNDVQLVGSSLIPHFQ